MWEVPLFDLNFDSRESRAVQDVLDSQWLTMGDQIKAFEAGFSELLGNGTRCFAVSSATAALHLSLLALDIAEGDEVIIPALTFVADANVVRICGATPVLADSVSVDDWNISARAIEQKITPNTKAVIVVHFAGFPCDMPAIMDVCDRHGVKVIEDVAHAPGASIGGRQCGTFGHAGCFSFFSNKNISIGEGGMVVSGDAEIASRLQSLRSHGMTTLTLDRHQGRAVSYDVERVGLNYRMDEMRAALGIEQLAKLYDGNHRRRQHYHAYADAFAETGISVPFVRKPVPAADIVSAYHIMPVLLPESADRLQVISNLRESGIQSSIHYPPFWDFSSYESMSPDDAPVVAAIAGRELTLPLFPTMTERQRSLVIDTLLGTIR